MNTDAPVLDRLLDPLRDCLTKDVAARIVSLRADDKTQALLDDYAEKHKEGSLTEKEQTEYESLVRAGAMIAVLQAKARTVLHDGE